MTVSRKFLFYALLGMFPFTPLLQAQDQFFATVGSGPAANVLLRSIFRLSNEQLSERVVILEFLDSAGKLAERPVEASWSEVGEIQNVDGRWQLTIPAEATLELAMTLEEEPWFGWARVQAGEAVSVHSFLQVARSTQDPSEALFFEDLLVREAEVAGTRGSRSFAFPTTYIISNQNHSSAFALVNLSDRTTEVRLTLRPDQTKTISIEPGEVFRSYFNEFWELTLPAVFPLRLEAVMTVQSDAPVAMTALSTVEGLPFSGIQVSELPGQEPSEASRDTEVELSLGESLRIAGTNVEVTFWNVPEDSRCAIGAVCVWEGRARIHLLVKEDGASRVVELIHQAGRVDLSEATIGDMRVELKSVLPIPNLDEPPILAGDYRIRLLFRDPEE